MKKNLLSRRAPSLFARLALLAAALLAWSACNLSDPAEMRHYIQLQLPDSLRIGDSVEVLLDLPGNQALVDTLWNGPLLSDTSLAKLPAPDYHGGDADLFVAAWHQSRLFYQTRVEYRKGQDKPKVLDILPPDSLPPVLKWQGPDSLNMLDRPSDSGLAALYPDMACVDDRDRDSSKPSLEVIEDSARVGLDWIRYRCRDRAGNVSQPRLRRLRIQTQVDTEPPEVLFQPDVDSLVSWIGHPVNTGSVSCRDKKDSVPQLRILGSADTLGQGGYTYLTYECTDASGNMGRRQRLIRVVREPDTVRPVITRRGPDSLIAYEGGSIKDTAAVECVDDRDGRLAIQATSGLPPILNIRGAFIYTYSCRDSSGNYAGLDLFVQVLRRPDSVPPILTLRGRDSLLVYDGEAYADSGADCIDERDGKLPVETRNPVDTRKRGDYVVTYTCADTAGNAASATRRVRVARKPDAVQPVLLLRGPDTALVYDHDAYKDSGAVCLDARDGQLPVVVQGSIDTGKRGLQSLGFACADSAGNASHIERMVRVARRPDAVKPIMTLRGPDSIQVWQGTAYSDSGAVCNDDRDGSLPIQISGTVNTALRALYTLTLHCADSSGNEASRIRKVLVIRVPDTVKPALSLRGPDSVQTWQGFAYADSGSDCVDDRDGRLQVKVTGAVNTALRGLQTLSFQCADSVGNQASLVRRVMVIRVPDAIKPLLTLHGPDSLQVWQGAAYADSGADCVDDRDGRLAVQVSGSVNTAQRGPQTLSYQCADSAGNSASSIRKVLVIRVPDTVKPVLTLRGAASAQTGLGLAYSDSGANCADARDGILPVLTQGSVNTGVLGIYVLTYACSDSAGNAAAAVTRSVTVAPLDTTPPVITLAGTDTLVVVSEAAFKAMEPGGVCRDQMDGFLPLTLKGITKPVTGPGWYQAGYACTDKSGNTAVKMRTLKLGLFGTYLTTTGDSQVDTTNDWANEGGTEGAGFVTEPGGNYFGLTKFDLSKVNKTGLKSAKLHYFTFIYGQPNVAGFRKYTFEVWRVKRSWVEGTGDWFFPNGGYDNGGEIWYQYYPLSDSMQAHVSNPSEPTGVTGADLDMVRDSAMVKVATQSDSVYFGDWCGRPDQLPAPDHLTPVELDITDYVKSADPANDFGFVVKVFGVQPGMSFAYLTSEAGSGPWAPRLMLEY